VNLANAAVSQALAFVGLAPAVALVGAVRAVLDELAPPAVGTASPQLLVERVEQLAVDLTDRLVADQRTDVVAGERLVVLLGVRLRLQPLEVPVEELIDGRLGPGVALFVDLGEQPDAGLLR
jgi:hypothetical protein